MVKIREIKIMAFIQPCFIRKNTPEIRKTLEALGYKASFGNINNDSIATSSITNTYSCISMSIFDNENPHINWKANGKRIDCGDNKELFIALAALQDDTNENQWFIAQRTMWDENYSGEITEHYKEGEWLLWGYYSFMEDIPSDFRKATAEEIIEHFKKD